MLVLKKMINQARSAPRIGNPAVTMDGVTGEKLVAIFPPTKVFQERVRTICNFFQDYAEEQATRGTGERGTSVMPALPVSISLEIEAILNEFENSYPSIVTMLQSLSTS